MLGTSKSIWVFTPQSVPGCTLWLDASDPSTMNSTTTVTQWNDKSGQSNNVTGTATLSGSNMTFNGTNQAFSNLTYVFPYAAYSLFAVYSNTTAPTSASPYMNVMYGSNGYPMLGVDSNKSVTALPVAPTATMWATRIASTGNDQGNAVATDSSGNVFVTGQYTAAALTLYSTGGTTNATLAWAGTAATNDAFLVKYSPNGTVLWAARIASTGDDIGQGVATDSSGNVFVTGAYGAAVTLYNTGGEIGATLAYTGVSYDVFLAKYSSTGSVLWATRFAGTGVTQPYGVATDPSGNVFVAAYFSQTPTLYNADGTTAVTLGSGFANDTFVAAYDPNGTFAWVVRIADTFNGQEIARAVATDSSGNVFVTGQYGGAVRLYDSGGGISATLPFTGGTDVFLAKYTSTTASVAWAAQIAGTTTSADVGRGVATDSSGNVFVTGGYGAALTLYNTGGTTGASLAFTGGADAFLAKYSSTGTVLWAAQIAGTSTSGDIGYGVATDPSGNVFVIGSYGAALTLYNTGGTTGATLTNAGGNDVFLAKYSSTGTVVWATRIAGAGADVGYGVATDPSGNVFVTGYSGVAALTLYNADGTTGATLALIGVADTFLAKYTSAGALAQVTAPIVANVGWAARIAASAADVQCLGVANDPSGNVFVTGSYNGALTLYNTGGGTGATLAFTGGTDAYIAKYSSTGTVLWAAQIAGTTTSQDIGYGVATDPSGNVFVTGYYSAALTLYNSSGVSNASLANGGGSDAFLAKYSSTGTVLWAARIATSASFEAGYGVATDPSGNVFVTGYYNAEALTLYNTGGGTGATLAFTGGNDVFIAKYSSTGTVSWAARIAGSGVTYGDIGYGVATDSSGNVFVTGFYDATLTLYNSSGVSNATLAFTGGKDAFLAKYTSAGAVSWATRITGTTTSIDVGLGVATDPSGNVFVTGYYSAALLLYNTSGTNVDSLAFTGGTDCFLVKYNSNGTLLWATRIASKGTIDDQGYGVATDPSGNVFVTGLYGAALTLYNTGGTTGATLAFAGTADAFLAKYSSTGTVLWAARIAGTGNDYGQGVATDSNGNAFVSGWYTSATTLYNKDGTTGATLAFTGTNYAAFLAKYSPDGYIISTTPANSNTLVSATYTPSTFSPFANGYSATALTGTTTATTGIYVGGPSNYFNGSLSELLVYNSTLNSNQRVLVEGYLARKWGAQTKLPLGHLYSSIPPFNRTFTPLDIPACSVWLDAADGSTMNSTTTVTQWNDKSGAGNNVIGTATLSGRNMTFDGSTQAFSNTSYVFPASNYSMFAVYSNTVAPAATAYMNAVYGGNGYPMLGVGANKLVVAQPVAANDKWAVQIAGTGAAIDAGQGVATDSSGNVFVTGQYGAALTLYNTGGGTGATLAFTGSFDAFLAKYSSNGTVVWAAQIAGSGADTGYGVDTDPFGNAFVTGQYNAALTLYNTGGTTGATLAFTGSFDAFLAKYSSTGTVLWAARIAGTLDDVGYGVTADPSGNVFVTGYYSAALTLYNSSGVSNASLAFTGGQDVFLAKYSSTGTVLWAAQIAGTTTSFDQGNGVATDSSGNVFVTGYYQAALTLYNSSGVSNASLAFTGGNDAFLAKYSSTGTVSWATRIAGTSTSADIGYGVATDSSGNVFVTGYYQAALTLYNTGGTTGATLAYTGGFDAFLAKYSSTGTVVWATRIAGTTTSGDIGNGVATDSSGNVFVTGYYTAALTLYNSSGGTGATLANAGGQDAFLVKYTSAGAVAQISVPIASNTGWAAQITGTTNAQNGQGVATDSSGNVFVTGTYQSLLTLYNAGGAGNAALAYTGGGDAFLAKYSSTGTVVWAVQIAGTGAAIDAGQGVATDSSGNVFVTGQYGAALTLYNAAGVSNASLAFTGGRDAFLAKYSSAGTVLWAAQIAGTTTSFDIGFGVATDSSGNVFVTGLYGAALTLYDSSGVSNASLAFTGGNDAFLVKYSPNGTVLWAARIASTGDDIGQGVATDSSGNVFVTGTYSYAALTLYNTGGTSGATLANTGGYDVFLAKYSSAGAVSWAAQITGTTTSDDQGNAVATDSSGNVFVTGVYGAALTLYNSSGTTGATLAFAGGTYDVFLAKYSSTGTVLWAAQIASTGYDYGYGVATDSSGNVFVTGLYGAALTLSNATSVGGAYSNTLPSTGGSDVFIAKYSSTGTVLWATWIGLGSGVGRGIATDSSGNVFVTGYYSFACTLYNKDGTTGATLAGLATQDVFLAKYNPDGYILLVTPANSNTLVSATYTPSTFSPFANGSNYPTLAGTTLATTGLYVGGPSNYFNGSLSELLIYASTLTAGQRQQLEGYLTQKWGLSSQIVSTQPYKYIPPITPTPIVATSVGTVTLTNLTQTSGTITWGSNATLVEGYMWYVGTGQGTGGVVSGFAAVGTYTASFTGAYLLPNTYYAWVTPYNIGGPGTATYATSVSLPCTLAASVSNYQDAFIAAYTTAGVPRWVAQIAGTNIDNGLGVATDPSGNVFVTGYYGAALTLYNAAGVSNASLAFTGNQDAYIAKYSSTGTVLWAAQIAGTGAVVDRGYGVATDSSGNVFVTGYYGAACTLYNTGGTTGATLAYTGGDDAFLAKYSSTGSVLWAARIAGAGAVTDRGYGVATDSSGNVFVIGNYGAALTLYNAAGVSNASLPFTITYDVFLAKYSSTGSVLWAAQIAGAGNDGVAGVATDSSGNVFVTGAYDTGALTLYNSSGVSNASLAYTGGQDVFLAKYSSTGTVVWAAQIAGAGAVNDFGLGVATDSSGNVFVTGLYQAALTLSNATSVGGAYSNTLAFAGGQDAFLAKYSSTGTVLWAARIAGTDADYGQAVATDSSGNVYVTGYYISTTGITLSNAGGTASSYTLPISANFGSSRNTQFIVSYTSAGNVSGAIALRPDNPTGLSVGQGIAVSGTNMYTTGYYQSRGPTTLQASGYAYPTASAGGTLSLPYTGGNDCFVAKYGPGGNTVWAAQIAGTTTSVDIGQGVATDSSGNVFVTGYYSAAVTLYNTGGGTGATLAFTGGNDAFLAKYSSTGTVLWAARIAGTTTSSDVGYGVATDSSGNVFVTGGYSAALTLYNSSGVSNASLAFTGSFDAFLAKYSSTGTVLWAAQIASTGTNIDIGYGVATDSSGNVFVTGYYQAALTLYNTGGTTGATLAFTGGNDAFLAKYSSTGTVLWAARIAGTSPDVGYGIATDSSGNVFVTGQYQAALTLYNAAGVSNASLAFTGVADAYIAKYSSTGTVLWAAQIAGTTTDVGYGVATDPSGNVFVTGGYGAALTLYNSSGVSNASLAFTGGNDAFLAKYSSTGTVVWAAQIAGTGTSDDRGQAVATDSSGNVVVTGYYGAALTLYNSSGVSNSALANTGSLDVFLAKYSSTGSVVWAAQIAGTSQDIGYGVATDSSGNVVVTGYYGAALSLSNAV